MWPRHSWFTESPSQAVPFSRNSSCRPRVQVYPLTGEGVIFDPPQVLSAFACPTVGAHWLHHLRNRRHVQPLDQFEVNLCRSQLMSKSIYVEVNLRRGQLPRDAAGGRLAGPEIAWATRRRGSTPASTRLSAKVYCSVSTMRPTPYTLHPTPYTLHPTPFT